MRARRVAAAGADVGLALLLGAAARLAHVSWYRAFETSVAVDLAGSLAVGAVFGAGHALVVAAGRVTAGGGEAVGAPVRPRLVAAAAAAGVAVHVAVAPAFTPFGLGPPGVNAVLAGAGIAVGLWSVSTRRTAP